MTNSFGVPAWRFIIRIASSPKLRKLGHFNRPQNRQLRSESFSFHQEEQMNAQLQTETGREVPPRERQLPTRNLSPQKGKTSDKPRLSIAHFPPSACRKVQSGWGMLFSTTIGNDICCQKEIVIRQNCHILETTTTLFLVICVFWAPPHWHE